MPSLEKHSDAIAEREESGIRRRRFRPRLIGALLLILGAELVYLGVQWRRLERIERRDRLELALAEQGGHSCDKFRCDGKDWVWAKAKTDAGLEVLEELRDLQILDLTDSQVTDAGLKHLKALPRLERLRLDGSGISDAGLEHLKQMPQLRQVYLFATQVTERGVAELKRALPNAEIAW